MSTDTVSCNFHKQEVSPNYKFSTSDLFYNGQVQDNTEMMNCQLSF
jgi:hypothetical protein